MTSHLYQSCASTNRNMSVNVKKRTKQQKKKKKNKQIFIYLFECFYFSFVLSGGGSMLIDSCTVAGVKAF